MAIATLKLKRPINEIEVDIDENDLEAVGYVKSSTNAAPEWVSVTDRLPDNNCRCLVYAHGYIETMHFARNLFEADNFDFFPKEKYERSGFYGYDSEYGHYEKSGVTHWMPLPEPPKMKGE